MSIPDLSITDLRGPATVPKKDLIRLPLELALLERLAKDPNLAAIDATRAPPDPELLRRQLLGRAVRLTEAMAPAAVRAAEDVKRAFGLSSVVEIYQSAGRENAAMHLLREPILMEIQRRLLPLLDDTALRAVIGHELGHFIAHGADSPHPQISALGATPALGGKEIGLFAPGLQFHKQDTGAAYNRSPKGTV